MVGRLAESRHEVEEYQRTLERKVEARTTELRVAFEKAHALADEAKQANRAKSEFLATMSHEKTEECPRVAALYFRFHIAHGASRRHGYRAHDTADRLTQHRHGLVGPASIEQR